MNDNGKETNSTKKVCSTEKINYLNYYVGHKRIKLRLVFEGIACGIVASLIVVLYRFAIDWADHWRNVAIQQVIANWHWIFLWLAALIVGGLVIAWSLRYEPLSSGSGIPQIKGMIIGAVEAKWYKVILAKFIGGIVAILGGFSLGREGPSIQLGSSASAGMGKLLKKDPGEQRILLTCGASAGLATAFNAPLAGLIFSLEEMHKNFSPIVLISALSSCVAADFISKQFFGMSPVLNFTGINIMPLTYYPYIIPLGILLGAFGLLFNKGLVSTQDLINQSKLPKTAIPVVIMVVVGMVGLALPQTLGGGHHLIMNLMEPTMVSWLLLLLLVKFILTMISYGSGAPGGIFLPLLALGALVGSIYGNLLVEWIGLPEVYVINFIILAMAATFTAIVRAPVTGIILIVEMTASFKTLLPVLAICLTAFFTAELMEYEPIYDTLLHRLLHKTKGIRIQPGSKKEVSEYTVCVGSYLEGKYLRDIELPCDSLIINITRRERNITPKGKFQFQVGDILAIMANKCDGCELREKILEITS
jgi:H+/Cl- antiporter ClcA